MEHFDPSYYRIKIEVGWSSNVQGFNAALTQKLQRAAEASRRTFLLCALDHDIKMDESGAVNLKISYRGYGDALFRTYRMNALIPYYEQERIVSLQSRYEDVLSKGQCTTRQAAEYNLNKLFQTISRPSPNQNNDRMSQLKMIWSMSSDSPSVVNNFNATDDTVVLREFLRIYYN